MRNKIQFLIPQTVKNPKANFGLGLTLKSHETPTPPIVLVSLLLIQSFFWHYDDDNITVILHEDNKYKAL